MPTLQADDIPALIESDEFKKLPFDQRQKLSEAALSEGAQSLAGAWNRETYQQWGQFANTVRQQIADSETVGEKVKWGANVAKQGVKDMGTIIGTQVVGLSPVVPVNGKAEAQVPGATLGKAMVTNMAKLGTGVVQKLTNDVKPLQSALDDVRKGIDNGAFFDHPQGLPGWLDEVQGHVAKGAQQYYGTAGGAEDWAQQNGLITNAENAQLLNAYLTTRSPQAWTALQKNLERTPALAQLNETERQIQNDATLGRALAPEARPMISEAADPAEVIPGLMAAKKGYQAAQRGMKTLDRAKALGKGVLAEVGGEQISATMDDPNLTWAERAEVAKQTLLASLGILGTGAAIGGAQRLYTDGLPRFQTTPTAAPGTPAIATPAAGAVAGGNPFEGPINAPPQPTEDGGVVGPQPVPSFTDNPYGTLAPQPSGGNVIFDYGIQRTPEAQAAFEERQRQDSANQQRAQGAMQQSARRMPVIPDNPLGYRDILDFVNDNPLHIPRQGSEARAQGEYDWTQQYELPRYYRKFLASSEGGHHADVLAQMAHDEGYIAEPTPDALMEQIQKTIRERTQHKVEFRRQQQNQRDAERRVKNFETAQAKASPVESTALDLHAVLPGDEFTLGRENVRITNVEHDEDGNVTTVQIEDGQKFGVLHLDAQSRGAILVDEFKPRDSGPSDPEQVRRWLEEVGWQGANERLGDAYKDTVKPAADAAKAAQARRAEIEDVLPPGWHTVPLPNEPQFDRYQWQALKDEHGNDVAWPLSAAEVTERAWHEYGREKRPDALSDPVYQQLKAEADRLEEQRQTASAAWSAIGEHPRTAEWNAQRAAEELAAANRRASAAKGRRTRAAKQVADEDMPFMRRPNPAISATAQADEWQKRIDDIETELEQQGVDIFKLYNPTDKGSEILAQAGWRPMPENLAQAYRLRDEAGARELDQSRQAIVGGLRQAGFSQPEINRILTYYAIDPIKSDAARQYLAATHTVETAKQNLNDQAESLAYALAAERGIPFDELKDVNSQTLRDAANAVKVVRAYLGLETSVKTFRSADDDTLFMRRPNPAISATAANAAGGQGVRMMMPQGEEVLAMPRGRGTSGGMASDSGAAQASNEPSPGGLTEAESNYRKAKVEARITREQIVKDAKENQDHSVGALEWEEGDEEGFWNARVPDGILSIFKDGDRYRYSGTIRDRENRTDIEFDDVAPSFEKAVEYAELEAGVAQSNKNWKDETAWENSINALIDTFVVPPGVHDFKFAGSGPGKLGAYRRSMSLYGEGYYDTNGEDSDANRFRFSVRDHEPTEKWQQIYGYLDKWFLVNEEMRISAVAEAIDNAEDWLAAKAQKSQSRLLTGQAGESRQDMQGSGPSKTGDGDSLPSPASVNPESARAASGTSEETLAMARPAVNGPLPSTAPHVAQGGYPAGPQPQLPAGMSAYRGNSWSGKVQTLHGIRRFLLDAVGLPAVGVRRFMEQALGIYKAKAESVRLQAINDIPVLAHEVGHHVHYRFLSATRGVADDWGGRFDGELMPMGQPTSATNYTPAMIRKEGVAEFTRLWLTSPAQARAQAPTFSAFWEAELEAKHPEVAEGLRQTQAMIEDYIAMPAFQKAKAQVVLDPNSEKPGTPIGQTLRKVYASMVNTLQPALDVMKQAATMNPALQSMADNVVLWMENHRGGWASKATSDVFGQQTDLHGKVVGDGLQTILKDLRPGEHADFSTYLALKRAAEIEASGKRSGFENARLPANEMRALEQRFEATRQKLLKWQENELQLLIDAGLMDQKSAADMRQANKDYVPFYRLYEKLNGVSFGPENSKNAGGYVDLNSGIRALKGSDRAIIDPLQSVMKNAFMFRKIAEQNLIGQKFFDVVKQVQGGGIWGEGIAPKLKPQVTSHDAIVQKLIDEGIIKDASQLPANADLTLRLFQAVTKPDTKNGEVIIFRDGKREHWEVKDPLLMQALKTADADAVTKGKIASWMLKIFTMPTRALRWGATGGPWFAIPNAIRDTVQAGILSKNGFIPFWDTARGAMEVLRKGGAFQAWQQAGGEFSGQVTGTQAFTRLIEDVLPKEPLLQRMLQGLAEPQAWRTGFHNALELIGWLSKVSEQSTRVGEFMRAKEKGASDMAAANFSKIVSLNFARAGEVSRVINQFVPFFNASLQGLDQLVRAHGDPKQRTAAMVNALMYVTVPTLLVWALGKDDEEIQNLPSKRKELFWNINLKPLANALGMPEKGFILSIPKPFLLGAIYGTSIEYALDQGTQRDPNGAKKAAKNILSNTINPFDVMMSVGGIRPVIEATTNHSLFTGMDIVPEGYTHLPKEQQYSVLTSQTARMLGKFTGQSPMMIDHLLRGYFATAGQFGAQAIDYGMAKLALTDVPPPPRKGWMELPILNRFAGSPYAANAFVGRFYAASKDMEGKIAVLNKQAEQMTTEEQRKWFAANRDELGHYLRTVDYQTGRTGAGDVRKAQATLSEINAAMKEIQASRVIKPDVKQQRMLELAQQRNVVAENAYKALFPEAVRRRHW